MKSLLRDGQGHRGGLLLSHAVNTHKNAHILSHSLPLSLSLTHLHTHTHFRVPWGCHISQYPVAWGELWPCHSIEVECVVCGVCLCGGTFMLACICTLCVFMYISGPLLICLFIKKYIIKPSLQISGVQNAAACVNDKMIYRNIPKIKSYVPRGNGISQPAWNVYVSHAINVCMHKYSAYKFMQVNS